MIVRVAKRSRFTIISNAAVEDDRLSFRALGLLTYLLSKPDDWNANVVQLVKSHTEGREAVRTALNELIETGYATRVWDTNGRTPHIAYVIHEHPVEPVAGDGITGDGFLGARDDDASNNSSRTKTEKTNVVSLPQSPTRVAARAAKEEELDLTFEKFWQAFPQRNGRKVRKKDARKMWGKMTAAQRLQATEALVNYKAYCARGAIAMDPSTFLNPNNERWVDYVTAVTEADLGDDDRYDAAAAAALAELGEG